MSFTITRSRRVITVHSDAADLSDIIEIDMEYVGTDGYTYFVGIPSSEFLTQSATDITFNIPDICRFILSLITVDFTGIQFDGSVPLGSLQILLADASGIYRIVLNKRNDTMYIASSVEPDTEDVAFPTPFAKTGFIGG